MTYKLAQFYADEMKSWERIVSILNEETDEHLSRIAMILKKNTTRDQTNQLNDQITVMLTYVNDFDELKMRIFSQRQRLGRVGTTQENPEPELRKQQDKLRNKIYTLQSTFCKAEHSCSTLVVSCLKPQ